MYDWWQLSGGDRRSCCSQQPPPGQVCLPQVNFVVLRWTFPHYWPLVDGQLSMITQLQRIFFDLQWSFLKLKPIARSGKSRLYQPGGNSDGVGTMVCFLLAREDSCEWGRHWRLWRCRGSGWSRTGRTSTASTVCWEKKIQRLGHLPVPETKI